MDFTKFRALDMKLLDRVDKMLSDDIAKLMVGWGAGGWWSVLLALVLVKSP